VKRTWGAFWIWGNRRASTNSYMIYFGTWATQQMMYQAYLEENFSKNAVCLFPEDSGEYDGDTVVSGSDIDSLLITIMNSHQISLSRRRAFKFLLFLESYLKGRSQRVSFQERNRMDKGVPLFFIIVSSLNDPSGMNTHLLREVLSQDR